jgi:hypothetical protein
MAIAMLVGLSWSKIHYHAEREPFPKKVVSVGSMSDGLDNCMISVMG